MAARRPALPFLDAGTAHPLPAEGLRRLAHGGEGDGGSRRAGGRRPHAQDRQADRSRLPRQARRLPESEAARRRRPRADRRQQRGDGRRIALPRDMAAARRARAAPRTEARARLGVRRRRTIRTAIASGRSAR